MRALIINLLYHQVHFRSCLLILILGSIVYGNHLQNPFQFDTVAYMINNHRLENINEQLSINYLIKDFLHRSLLQISIAFNAHLDGYRTFSYHLVNLVLHLINCLLIYFITSRMWFYLKSIECKYNENETHFIALFTAILFLLHPLQTESVIYIMSRSEVFAGTFYLSAFLLFQVYLAQERPIRTVFKFFVFLIL